ncbi:hypothetical protein BKI52_21000 [marine bacterium AO1-C]|nr:hypothetical protein BKI52_21000 [marine bacterium AO1-C]
MRILHINTSDNGGAGKAVVRLMNGLLKNQVKNDLLVLYKYQENPHTHKFTPDINSTYKKLQFSLKYRFHQYKQKRALNNKSQNFEVFSFPESLYEIKQHPLFVKADIIHLHWVAGFVDYPSFFKDCNKHIVWTLHDLNPFGGGFHYEGDFLKNIHEYKQLDTKIRKTKQKAFSQLDKLHIVSPSQWMLQEAQNQPFLKKFQHLKIPNGINLDIYKSLDQTLARQKYKLPTDKKIILFLAENIHNKRKGFDLLRKALHQVDPEENLVLLVGSHQNVTLDFPHKKLGYINEDTKLAEVYACADVCVVPSLEDNLPNTMLESLACGVPVVAFDTGGIPDMVTPYKTGLLAPTENHQMLGKKINEILSNPQLHQTLSQNARKKAISEFSLDIQTKRYIEIYQQVLQKKVLAYQTS